MTRRRVRKVFTAGMLDSIEKAIAESERRHGGEIRFAVEGEFSPHNLWRNLSPRDRAVQVFAELGVWDTELNNGVLIYVSFADRDVEIVADRGYRNKVTPEDWASVCSAIERAFREGRFERGVLDGIEAAGALIARHFPEVDRDELPDAPALL